MGAERRPSVIAAAVLTAFVLAGCAVSSAPIETATVADAPTVIGVSDGDLCVPVRPPG